MYTLFIYHLSKADQDSILIEETFLSAVMSWQCSALWVQKMIGLIINDPFLCSVVFQFTKFI